MFTHPYLASQLARERERDMLAQADQQRLARQLRDLARASRQATSRTAYPLPRLARCRPAARRTADLTARTPSPNRPSVMTRKGSS